MNAKIIEKQELTKKALENWNSKFFYFGEMLCKNLNRILTTRRAKSPVVEVPAHVDCWALVNIS